MSHLQNQTDLEAHCHNIKYKAPSQTPDPYELPDPHARGFCVAPRFTTGFTNNTKTTEIMESCCPGPVAVYGEPFPCWAYCNVTRPTMNKMNDCMESHGIWATACEIMLGHGTEVTGEGSRMTPARVSTLGLVLAAMLLVGNLP